MAQHYNVTVIPARPRKPKDKAKVETGVLVAQRWILAKLRNRVFFELGELNQAIWELLDELNERPFQKLEGTRASAFEELDKPAMQPLPPVRYELADRRNARVNIDYHVEYEGRHYSVPYQLVHEAVEVRATAGIVEIFLRADDKRRRNEQRVHSFRDGDRVATHGRSYGRRGAAVTEPAHRPANHRDQVWPPERLVSWARKFGPSVATVVEQMLARYVVPEQGYRACLGLLRAAERHGGQRMDAAWPIASRCFLGRRCWRAALGTTAAIRLRGQPRLLPRPRPSLIRFPPRWCSARTRCLSPGSLLRTRCRTSKRSGDVS
jgi:hypothetical protein